MNTDPFVRKAMKLWNNETYEAARGYTKRATLDVALMNLFRYSGSDKSFGSVPSDYRNALEQAIFRARKVFIPEDKLIKVSLAHGTDSMNLDSAAGFSFPGKKKSEVVQEAYDIAAYLQHQVQRGRHVYRPPCKIALRGHLTSVEEPKSRPVWVYPFELSILEAKWAIPFYKHLETNVKEVHFGEGAMPRLAQLLMGGLSDQTESAEVTLDWSSFDSSIPSWLIKEAFDILHDCFDDSYADVDGTAVYGGAVMVEKNSQLWKFIVEYFIKTPIMLPNGDVYVKTHGIPSGSFFTQAVGTIVNAIIVYSLDIYYGWNGRRFRFLGDDSSFLIPIYRNQINPTKLADTANSVFGVTLKIEKLHIATTQLERKFLGYRCQGYRFIRSDHEWITNVLYPERDIESLEQSASRVLAYYILGGCNSEPYCSFFHDYFRRYPQIQGRKVEPTRSLKRLLRYVLRMPLDYLELPDLRLLDVFSVATSLSLGDPPFLKTS